MGPQIFSHKVFENDEMLMLNSINSNFNDFLGIVINKKEELIAFGQFKEF